MNIDWNFSENRPIYLQIVEQIKQSLVSGSLIPGDKLPSVRELASAAGVNPNTMQRAFAELEREELVYSQRTSGRFITENEDLIKQLKVNLAKDIIAGFLNSMKQLGFDREQAAELIKTYEEVNKNE